MQNLIVINIDFLFIYTKIKSFYSKFLETQFKRPS